MKRFILFVLACLILVPAPVFAQDDISTLEDLIPYVQSLAERIEILEAQIVPGVTKATWDGSDIVSTTPDSKIGNYDVAITKIELNKNKNGEDVVTFYAQFTNNSDETVDFWKINKKAFQNGIEIDDVIESPLYSNWDTDIRPGVSIDVSFSFLLFDTENPVELELSDSSDWDSEPVLYVADLSQASKE